MPRIRPFRSITAALVTVLVAAGAFAQGGGTPPTEEAAPLPRAAAPRPGRLILDGSIVEGPYQIAIEGPRLVINGRALVAVPRPGPVLAVTAEIEARHQILTTLAGLFSHWDRLLGRPRALAEATAWLQAQPLIAEARTGSQSHLELRWRTAQDQERVDFVPPGTDDVMVSPEALRKEYLESQARAIRHWLASGSLVIWNEGVRFATKAIELLPGAVAAAARKSRRAIEVGART